nr:sodium ion-translocating decarboxylase subunit beta [Deferrisoma camini]
MSPVVGWLADLGAQTGFLGLSWGHPVMWALAGGFLYLAIAKKFEPLLLVPIAFGMLVVNLPGTGLMEPGEGLLWRFFHYGIEWEVIPPLIFLGLGAMTDFGPLLSQPRLIFLGAGAQVGVYITFFCAHLMGFDLKEAATIGIIGGADGPTTIYLGSRLAPHMLGTVAVAAYSYMAMVPLIQPPIMRLMTTRQERRIRMSKARKVHPLEKILFPVVAAVAVILLVPASAPLMAMFMLGNLFRESKVVDRLTGASQNELMNIVTILLGISVGATMRAETFLQPRVIFVFVLGLFAFMVSTASGIALAKLMNLVSRDKVNPLLGAAGVSAVPMAARVVHKVASEEDRQNYLLMYAMGPNVAGVLGTLIAAGVFLAMAG